ncbi:phage holin family protein [Thermodesulfobacteriota bacterium]
MLKKIVRWLILTAAIMVASYLLDGIQVSGFFSALFGAVILSLLNIFFRPVLIILTLPINILSLGLFTFVINAFLLMMVSGVISGFEVRDFWAALWGALLISIVNGVLSSFISDKGKVEKVSSTIEMKKTGDDRWE